MHTMPSMDYKGYAVAVNTPPAPANRYYSVFLIRRHSSHMLGIQPPVAYQEGVSTGVTFESAELARDDAAKRARKWIDAHPIA